MNGSLLVCLSLLAGFSFSVCKAEKPVEAIAFGSCLKQTRPQPIWESVRASKPDVFVLLGDNIYGDTRDMEKLRADGTPSELSPNSRNFVPIVAFLRSGMITITGRTMPVGISPKSRIATNLS